MDLSQLREEQPKFCRKTIERAERFTADLHSRIILGHPQDEFDKPCIELNAYSTGLFDSYHIQITFHACGSVYLNYGTHDAIYQAMSENSISELAWDDFVHRSSDGREEVAKKEYSWLPQNLIQHAGYFLYCMRWKVAFDLDKNVILLGAAPNQRDGITDYYLGFRISSGGVAATLGANHRSA